MATFLDIGLLQKFDLIFPFLLVLVVVYGMMTYYKFLGDNRWIHSLVALIFGIIVLLSDATTRIINAMAPWFILLVLGFVFIIFLIKSTGASDSDIHTLLIKNGPVMIILILVGIGIIVYSILDQTVWKEETSDSYQDMIYGGDTSASGKEGFFAVLTNPNVLGLLFLFLIGTFTIISLNKGP